MTTRRRVLITLGAGALAAVSPLATALGAEAQRARKTPLIGLLDYSAPDAARVNWWNAFRQAMRDLGYVEGQSVAFEARWAQGRVNRLPDLAAELVGLRVDVIVTGGGETARAAKQATGTIPIVMATGADPVKLGVVESLGRPGGNVTGVTSLSSELIVKRVELLRELLPRVSRLAVLWDGTKNSEMSVHELEEGVRPLGISITAVGVRDPTELEAAFSKVARERALFVVSSPSLFSERKRIADLALKHRLPTVVGGREYAEAGGLLSYAVRYPDLFRRAASYVDKILKGARPADLPVEQPTAFELILNMRTAKALGLKIPQSFTLRADQIIE